MWLVPLGVSAVKTGATTRGSLKTHAFAFVAWAAQAWHKKCGSKIYSLQMRCSTPVNFVHVLSKALESSSCHQKAVHHRTAPTGKLKAKDASDTCRTAMGMRRCLTHKSLHSRSWTHSESSGIMFHDDGCWEFGITITYHKFSAAKHLKNQAINVINSCRSTWLSQLSARTYRIHTAMYRLWIAASLRSCSIWYDVVGTTVKVWQRRAVAWHLFSRTIAVRDLEPKGHRFCDPWL